MPCPFLFNVSVVVMLECIVGGGGNRDWKLKTGKGYPPARTFWRRGEPQARKGSTLISSVDASASPDPQELPSTIFWETLCYRIDSEKAGYCRQKPELSHCKVG